MINTIILGDNLEKSKQYLKPESIDLIATDPLWKTNKNWLASDDVGTVGYYEDNFPTLESYLEFLLLRVDVWYKLMKPGARMILHVDADYSAYIRIHVMDRVFGRSGYRNTIQWSYSRWTKPTKNRLNKLHQDLLLYAKKSSSGDKALHEIRVPLEEPRIRNLVDGKTRTSLRDEDGNVINREQVDRPLGDVWGDIPTVPNTGGERVNYPTQKPLALYARIITMFTDEGDVVFDPFMGSGTTLVAAAKLGRSFIGMDNERTAFNKTRSRLMVENIPVTVINGKTVNVKGVDDMSEYEYQEYIVNELGGSVGPRGADGGIDGVVWATSTGIGVSKSQTTRQKVAQFATDLETKGLKNGLFVSPVKPTTEAIREAAKIRMLGKVNIELKLDAEIIGEAVPKVDLRVDGFKVYAAASGFRNTIVNYCWSVNDNDSQLYMFGPQKFKLTNKNDKVGMQDFSKVIKAGDLAHIKCIVSDSAGNSKVAELSYKF